MVNENVESTTLPKIPIEELQKEIIKMQNQVAARAKGTQGFILAMTLVAFCIGVLLVVIAVAQIILKGDFIFGAISSAGGMATVLGTLLYDPMKRAQKSVGDLVQVQVAFLSFNSKVTIWIEYVKAKIAAKDAKLQQAIVEKINEDIETAAKNALQQIQRYCKDGTPKNSEP